MAAWASGTAISVASSTILEAEGDKTRRGGSHPPPGLTEEHPCVPCSCPAPLLMLGYQPPGASAQPWAIRYLQAQGCHIHHLQGSPIGTEQVPGFVVGADLE